MVSLTVKQLYGEPNSHTLIPHPDTNEAVTPMSTRELVKIAEEIVDAISQSKTKEIFIIESGVAPLSRTCELIAAKRGLSLNWNRLKVSRESDEDFWFDGMPQSLESALLFDEYVGSGTIIKKASRRAEELGFQSSSIVCYSCHSTDPNIENRLEFAKFRGRDNSFWREGGVYIGENRIDLIGYFFVSGALSEGPHSISDYIEQGKTIARSETETFLAELYDECENANLDTSLKQSCRIDVVADFLITLHCVRAALAELSQAAENEEHHSFLAQAADMYGPMWSPYPDSFHLDFENAVSIVMESFRQLPNFPQFLETYIQIQSSLFQMIAEEYEKVRSDWNEEILTTLNGDKWTT